MLLHISLKKNENYYLVHIKFRLDFIEIFSNFP